MASSKQLNKLEIKQAIEQPLDLKVQEQWEFWLFYLASPEVENNSKVNRC